MTKIYCDKKQIESLENSAFTTAQLNEIRKRTPESETEIKTDENGFKYKTIKGSYMKKKMNLVFGWDWDFQIISREYFQASREVIVHGRLTIRSGERTIIKEQFGKHYLTVKTTTNGNATTTASVNIGNGYKSAATDAFKKCASEIGLCWDVYTSETKEAEVQPEINHQDKKVYDRLNDFLSKCTIPEEVEATFEHFESNTEVKPEHKELLKSHMQRVLKE